MLSMKRSASTALNAQVFVAAPYAIAMEFDLFGERRNGHSLKGGGVNKRESGRVISTADCKLRNAIENLLYSEMTRKVAALLIAIAKSQA
jgi:hypothetical protein